MITFKPIIIQGGRRKDGTWPVRIRVTFKGTVRRLSTTIVCTDADLTRTGRIKNPTILEKAGELIKQMRAACDTLSPFVLESWDVDKVVQHIRGTLSAQTFRLDFIAFGREFVMSKEAGTRLSYITALNAFERFNGGDIDINEITRSMIVSFQEWADTQDRVIFNRRKGVYQSTGHPTAKGGNSGRWVQRVIDARPEKEQERIAVAAFVLSFGTMGANMADLYDAAPFKGDIWRYNRRKTARRRRDRAEVSCRLEREISQAVGMLQEREGEGWLPGLHVLQAVKFRPGFNFSKK